MIWVHFSHAFFHAYLLDISSELAHVTHQQAEVLSIIAGAISFILFLFSP
jgi:hypothetical protein